jgi:hypothetical protein
LRSQPVHATGRYTKNSLIEILQTDFGFKKVFSTLAVISKACHALANASVYFSRQSIRPIDIWMHDYSAIIEEGKTDL